jgi:hypothetical protein
VLALLTYNVSSMHCSSTTCNKCRLVPLDLDKFESTTSIVFGKILPEEETLLTYMKIDNHHLDTNHEVYVLNINCSFFDSTKVAFLKHELPHFRE